MKAAILRVTIYDPDTGIVEQEIVSRVSDGGAYGHEIERHLERLGQKLAPILDEYHERP